MTSQNITYAANNTKPSSRFRITRQGVLALTLILIAVLMIIQGNRSLSYDVTTQLTIDPNQSDGLAVLVPTLAYMNVTALFFLIAGGLGLAQRQGWEGLTRGLMIVAGIVFIPTILIIAAAGGSTNITTMIGESFRLATPIAIGAMAGLWCERSGVVNIAIEGMMLFGACFGFTAFFYLRVIFPGDQIGIAMFLSVIVAILSGGLAAMLHAWLSLTFSTDQIVSGTVINILAVGVTSFVRREFLLSTDSGTQTLPRLEIPILSDIPIIGNVFFNNQPIFYSMFFIILISHLVLYYTRWGLRVRAVGEQPNAADTLGIKVNRTRWMSVVIGGMIAGVAGAWFSLEATGRFNDSMTRGAGFIALAALIFGKWTPLGAFSGALLFGFADSLGTRFQIIGVAVPVQFLQMVPYLVTLIVLAGLVGRAFPPKAVGKPYKKE